MDHVTKGTSENVYSLRASFKRVITNQRGNRLHSQKTSSKGWRKTEMNETSSVNWGSLLERKLPIAYLSQQLALISNTYIFDQNFIEG